MTEPTPEEVVTPAESTPEPVADATPDLTPTPSVVQAITDHLGEQSTVTAEQVNLVLTAWNAVKTGDPVGTIVKDPATGAIAHRVDSDGVHLWRVSAPDGTQWADLSPTLPGWEVLVPGAGS
jgi:hypothetical protein